VLFKNSVIFYYFGVGNWSHTATHLVVVVVVVVVLFGATATLFKERLGSSFQIGSGWNLADCSIHID